MRAMSGPELVARVPLTVELAGPAAQAGRVRRSACYSPVFYWPCAVSAEAERVSRIRRAEGQAHRLPAPALRPCALRRGCAGPAPVIHLYFQAVHAWRSVLR